MKEKREPRQTRKKKYDDGGQERNVCVCDSFSIYIKKNIGSNKCVDDTPFFILL